MDDFDYDDGDKFMEDSIKEAEAEVKAKKQNGTSSQSMEMQAEIKKLEDESNTKKDQQSDPDAKKTSALAENIADDALNSKTIVDYNGTNVNVTNIDGVSDTNAQIEENKNAIHQALEEVNNELGRKTEPRSD